ncbi:hypothetical protein L596_028009 [Steinernema carpocapsae]|uniref:Uncharacterized protein n=1 Tax=Steinernema carpocapsae TaxID=34508 RepID=A0A4U5LX93_STECR|nr:hypothetical protein L596_028009 [Steinernema carpocapsae]
MAEEPSVKRYKFSYVTSREDPLGIGHFFDQLKGQNADRATCQEANRSADLNPFGSNDLFRTSNPITSW